MTGEIISKHRVSNSTDWTGRFIQALNASGIAYCQWKSTETITAALSGDGDLDLLVASDDYESTIDLLSSFGFKQAQSISGLILPGVYHYFGYDSATEQFLHIHLYRQLLTGESLVQTHRFPLESMLLEHPDEIDGVKVASPTAELAVFVLRMMIKCGSLLEWAWFGDRSAKVKIKLDRLLQTADPQQACDLLEAHGVVVDSQLFLQSVCALSERQSFGKRFSLGRKMWNQLRPYARFGRLQRIGQYGRLTRGKIGRIFQKSQAKKSLIERGVVIAFAGGDASGKSTLIGDVETWLSPVFRVRRFHVGKPVSSVLTFPIHALLPLARKMFPHLRRNGVAQSDHSAKRGSDSLLQAVRAVALAFDRRRLVRKVHRQARQGTIVLCDRYPSTALGAMDSPRIRRSTKGRKLKSRLISLLASWELKLYEQIPAPDVVVKLTVPIDIARQRNALRHKADKHPDDELVARHQSFRRWNRQGTKATVELDTQGEVKETIKEVRKIVWDCL